MAEFAVEATGVVTIGDGASDQGTVAEALNLAVVLNLPMIFMYENNYYAEFTKNPKLGVTPKHRT